MIPFYAWWIIILTGVGLSALYSGLETGVYRLNRVRLHVLEHRGDRRATQPRPRRGGDERGRAR